MRFAILILKLLLVAPVVYLWQTIRHGKFGMAISVILMSPYMVIPFIILGVKTKWWIGLLSGLGYMVVMTVANYVFSFRMLSRMSEKDWDKAIDSGMKTADKMMGEFAKLDLEDDRDPSVISMTNAVAKGVIESV